MKTSFLRNVDIDTEETEALFLAQAQLKMVDAGYQEMKLETPEWVTDKLQMVGSEIVRRSKAELQRRLRAAMARKSAMRSRDEKRADLDAEINEIQSKLAGQ